MLIYFARGVFALLTFYLFKKKKSLQNTIDELRTQNSQLQSELAAKNIELARISETLKQQRQNQDAGQVRNKRKRKKNSFFSPSGGKLTFSFCPPLFFLGVNNYSSKAGWRRKAIKRSWIKDGICRREISGGSSKREQYLHFALLLLFSPFLSQKKNRKQTRPWPRSKRKFDSGKIRPRQGETKRNKIK